MGLAATAMAGGAVGEYQVQAAIAALHDGAERAADTDWPQILGLYGLLERLTGNPVVTLNRAVATAMVHGPRASLEVLEPLRERLPSHHRLDTVRGLCSTRSATPRPQWRAIARPLPGPPVRRSGTI